MEMSIILPALNEEKSIGKTIMEIKDVLSKNKIKFEIIVVDSDSKDKTAVIARSLGAKVVNAPIKGYGNALRRGFKEAKGKYIIMYDPDGTYDPNTLTLMIKTLKEGYDYVNANRFAELIGDSMSTSHHIGNLILNCMGNFLFRMKGKDVLSGYKGFRVDALKKLDIQSQKWDLNIEIHSKIRAHNLKFKEIPTRYFSRVGKSKLSGTKAAWHNLKFMFIHSPNFTFVYPSIVLMLVSIFAIINILIGPRLGSVSLVLSTIMFITGFQMLLFGITSKTIAFKKGFEKKNLLNSIGLKLTLEKGLISGLILFTISFVIFLSLNDIKFSILGFTILMTSISVVTYSFLNETLNQ